MDADGNGTVNKTEAQQYFKGKFGKLSAKAMFNEVDTDKNEEMTCDEFTGFWRQVKGAGYTEEQIIEELDNLGNGESWVDFKDGRDVGDAGGMTSKSSKE